MPSRIGWVVAMLIFGAWSLAIPAVQDSLAGALIMYAIIVLFALVTVGLIAGWLCELALRWWRVR